MRATTLSWATTVLASCRLRLADLHSAKCRRPARERTTLPVAVNLNRLATDLRVLLRAIGFGIRGEEINASVTKAKQKLSPANNFLESSWTPDEFQVMHQVPKGKHHKKIAPPVAKGFFWLTLTSV